MAKLSKPAVTVILILSCIALIGGIKYFKAQKAVPEPTSVLPQRAKGNPQAEVKIIEFIDFQCPACAVGAKAIHEYLEKNPGRFYVELRYFPLAMHRHGITSARWGECAVRQNKFWPFFDRLIEKQSEWSVLTDATPSFSAIAKEVGLNQSQIDTCLQDQSVDETINADVSEGKMREVSSTPTYFINHEMIVGAKSMRLKVDSLLGIKTPEPSAANPTSPTGPKL